MVNPIDYTLDVVNPFQAAMQGFQTGQQIVSNQEIIQAQRAAEERKQVELLQKQKQQEDLYNFSLIPNKTYEDFVGISNKYPSMSEDFKRNWEIQNEGQQQDSLRISSQAYVALRSNQPQVAKDILDDQITAYENSGYKKEAFNLKRLKVMIDQNPQGAETSIGMMMSSVNPDKFKDILGTIGQEDRADQMQPYEINKVVSETGKNNAQTQGQVIENRYKPQQLQGGIDYTNSQTALNYANIQNLADRLALDYDKLQTETEFKLQELNPTNIKLSDSSQKLVNDTMAESVASELSASKMSGLADRFEKGGQGGGLYTKGWVGFKRLTGWSDDDQSAMMREYERLRNGEAIKSLPPGPATDRDIELALRGLPPANADSTTITSFLRGMSKMSSRDAAYQQMKAEWVNQVGGLGSPKRDVEVMGVRIPSGTSFPKFASQNLDRTLKSQSNRAIQTEISSGQRSYMSFAQ